MKIGDTAFINACSKGHTEIVELWLQRVDLNVNIQNVDNKVTALMAASRYDHRDIVRLLLVCHVELKRKSLSTLDSEKEKRKRKRKRKELKTK